jgi:glycine betaine/choline ABC-type transport system substrate-binding protein
MTLEYTRYTIFQGSHCVVVAKVRERFAVSKQSTQNFDVEKFNFRKLSELEFMKQYQIKISNGFAALENLRDSEDLNRAWENIKENIKREYMSL